MTYGPANSISSYLPPEQDYPEDNKLFREILSNRQRNTADIVNLKENAQYEKNEMLTGQQWFSAPSEGAVVTSYTYRLAFDLVQLNGGSIANGGATTIPLTASSTPAAINIATAIQPTRGFGAASNGTNIFFINDPSVFVKINIWTTSSQNIIITNNSGASLTQAVWVMEYFKT